MVCRCPYLLLFFDLPFHLFIGLFECTILSLFCFGWLLTSLSLLILIEIKNFFLLFFFFVFLNPCRFHILLLGYLGWFLLFNLIFVH